jgi:ABC-type transport system involved in multi-copper enzyme maturation permease subunit
VSLVQSCAVRMRRTFPLSNSPAAWRERLGLAFVAGGAVLLFLFADQFTPGQELLLGALVLLTLGILVRQRWFTLVGPVLGHEMVRTARRSRFTLYRLYAYFVVVLVAFFYAIWYAQTHHGPSLTTRQTAAFAQGFFYSFLGLQVVAVCVLAPGYLAGVITEEKERRTLEYLLATDLRNREIVLGKTGARFGNLLLMLFTGLPIVSLVELMGGVDPLMAGAGFGIAAMTAFSLAGLCVLTSVYARKTRTALVLVYLAVVVYLILSCAAMFLYPVIPPFVCNLGPVTLSGAGLLDTFTAGNPFLQMIGLARDFAGGGGVAQSVVARFQDYAFFHGLTGVICTAWAIIRLRAVFFHQADHTPPASARRPRWLRRPRVGDQPMIWKEVFAEEGLRFGRFGKLLLAIVFLGSFLSLISFLKILSPRSIAWQIPNVMSIWSAAIGCAVACLLLLGVAVRAANSLSGERDRQTLDGLLATPLAAGTILFAKWLGSILSVRLGWLWLGVIWALGYLLGIWYGWVVGLLAFAWLVYAAFLAMVGLWFSLVSRTSLRATVYTLGVALVMGIVFLVPTHALLFPDDAAAEARARPFYQFQRGLSPPAALSYLLPFALVRDAQPAWRKDVWNAWDFQSALWGLAIWTAATLLLWHRLNMRFRKATGR